MFIFRCLLLFFLSLSLAHGARDGNGNYNLPAGNPVERGTTISSNWANSTLSDVATALTNSIARDGQTSATGNIPMGNYVLKGLGNGTQRSHSVNVGQIQDSSLNLLSNVAGTDNITATLTNLMSYANGQVFNFKAVGVNSGGVSININGMGAKTILNNGLALTAGSFQNGRFYQIIYDGTQFNLLGGLNSSGGGGLDNTKLLKTGDNATGAYTFNTTNTNGTANQVYPIKFTHSNVYTNSPTPYGSGTVLVQNTGQDNNQPLLVVEKTIGSSSFGNGANLILKNVGGSTATGDSTFATDLEFVTNNPNTTIPRPEGGKWEIGTLSNNNSTSKTGCGNFYFAPRRNNQHPSGANTGFDTMLNLRPWSCGGEIEHLGNLFSITPKYNNGNAKITIDNQYGDVSTELTSTSIAGNATLLLYGNTGGNSGKWRVIANGTSGRFQVRDDANGGAEGLEISANDDGLTSVYQRSDKSVGRLRLGNSSPSKILSADSTNTFNFGGSTGVKLTTQGGYYVNITDLEAVSASDGGTTNISTNATKKRILLNTGLPLSSYSIVFPTTPVNSTEVCTSGRSTVTTLTATSSDVGATVFNGIVSNLTAGQSACWTYRTTGNAWWRIQ